MFSFVFFGGVYCEIFYAAGFIFIADERLVRVRFLPIGVEYLRVRFIVDRAVVVEIVALISTIGNHFYLEVCAGYAVALHSTCIVQERSKQLLSDEALIEMIARRVEVFLGPLQEHFGHRLSQGAQLNILHWGRHGTTALSIPDLLE